MSVAGVTFGWPKWRGPDNQQKETAMLTITFQGVDALVDYLYDEMFEVDHEIYMLGREDPTYEPTELLERSWALEQLAQPFIELRRSWAERCEIAAEIAWMRRAGWVGELRGWGEWREWRWGLVGEGKPGCCGVQHSGVCQ